LLVLDKIVMQNRALKT